MRKMFKSLALVAALAATPAWAASEGGATDTDTKSFGVIGNVPALCVGGTLTNADGNFDMGVLTNTTTGLLRTDLSAPDKLLAGSFCSARSTITVEASPMLAQNFTATPPAGYSRTVNYTATASGWTVTPASYATGALSNSAAVQQRDTAFTGDIVVGVSDFTTGGGSTLRLVADTNYLGTVTVTLAVVS